MIDLEFVTYDDGRMDCFQIKNFDEVNKYHLTILTSSCFANVVTYIYAAYYLGRFTNKAK